MASTKKQERAIKALQKARENRYKLMAIYKVTGVSMGQLSAILRGVSFSDECADKIIDGCRKLRRSA